MTSRFGLIRRKSGMSDAAFLKHWSSVHGPLVARLPYLQHYYQNRITNAQQVGVDHPRGDWQLDGFSELQFASEADMHLAVASKEFPPTVEDVRNFLSEARLIICDKNVVVPRKTDAGPLVKRISLLKRRPDVSPEQFRHEWFGKHADFVSRWPGVMGYHQNFVVDRYSAITSTGSYDDVPVDGLVEFWFRTEAEVEGLFKTELVQETQRHAYEFISEITTFFVEDVQIC